MQRFGPLLAGENWQAQTDANLELVADAVAVEAGSVAGACLFVLLFFGCKETSGNSAQFEAYGVPRWSAVPSGWVQVQWMRVGGGFWGFCA